MGRRRGRDACSSVARSAHRESTNRQTSVRAVKLPHMGFEPWAPSHIGCDALQASAHLDVLRFFMMFRGTDRFCRYRDLQDAGQIYAGAHGKPTDALRERTNFCLAPFGEARVPRPPQRETPNPANHCSSPALLL